MKYFSTRGGETATASQAIRKGLAADGGLFVPSEFPDWSKGLRELATLSYPELCFQIVRAFFPEFGGDAVLFQEIEQAYREFSEDPPLRLFRAGDVAYLELYHGKTCAFKDFALSILPALIRAAKRADGISEETRILTATSGDTGKAALSAFGGQNGFRVAVLYPEHGTSETQELQMLTDLSENAFVGAVRGNFDDAQRAVKEMMREYGDAFSSANSVNIGRLIPQIAYYFYGYFLLCAQGALKENESFDVSVPTGNFGDILAGYYAKQMGLPVEKLICASNRNRVLTDCIQTGVYDVRREFYVTNSPSMDILISSNFERLLYACGVPVGEISEKMECLNREGHYRFRPPEDFVGYCCSEEQTREEIGRLFRQYGYLIDTHTAVASRAAALSDRVCMVLSTASAFKFAPEVLKSLGKPSLGDASEALTRFTGRQIPAPLKDLKLKPKRVPVRGTPSELKKYLLEFFGL